MLRHLSSATAAVLMAAVLTGCGDDGITLPDERVASAIEITAGDDQTATVGAPLPQPVEALVTDAQGRPVVDQLVEFTVTGGGAPSPASVQTDASGIAATGWVLGTTAGTQTLTARPVGSGAASVTATAQAVATAGPAASIAGVSGTPQSAVAGTPLANPLVVEVEDEFGNGVPGVLVQWTVTGGGAVSESETVTDAQGRASVTRTLGTSTGAQGTEASVDGLDGSPVSFAATSTVGSAGRLTIERQPSSSASSGAAFGIQPQVQLRDASNNPVPQSGVAIQADLASGPAGAALIGTNIAATNGSGLATFSNLGITGPAGQYTIVFSGAQSSLAGATSNTITIAAGAPTALRFATQPTNTTSGATLSPAVRVELIDAQGNVVTGQSRTVTLQLQGTGGSLSGTTSVATTAGVATFSSLSVSGSGTYRLQASASGGGVSSVLSDQFSVSPGAATKLVFTTQPTAVDAGDAISPAVRVEARDASDNLVTSFSGSVTMAIANNPAGGTLSGTTTVTASGGVAIFSNLSINRAGTGYTLRATSSGLSDATSTAFTVRAGSGSTLAKVAGDGQTAPVNTILPTDPRVRLTDANDNPVAGVTVTFTVVSGGGSITGTTPTTNANGEAALGSWRLGTTPGENSVSATAPGASSVTFTATATAGSGSGLELVTEPPSTSPSGAILTPAPVLQIVDAQGNPVTTSGIPLTIAISSGATLGGGATTRNTDANGRVSFTGVTASGTVGDYTLTFSGQGTPLTRTLTLTSGSASQSQSSVELSPSTVSAGGTTTVTVTARDAQGNPIAGADVALSTAPGPGSFGDESLTTAANGTATTTFQPSAAGTQTISATITGAGGPVTVSAPLQVESSVSTTNILGHEPSPSTRGQQVAVEWSVTSGTGTPVGAVNVTTNEGAACSGTTASGGCALTFATAGTWTITATYAGGGPHAGSADTEQHEVTPAESNVTIAGFSADPAVVGQQVTVSFDVASALGTPEGTVEVTTQGPDGAPTAGDSCQANVSAGSCDVAFGAPGEWLVTATYGGSAGFFGDEATGGITVTSPPEGSPSNIEIRRQPSATARSGQQLSAQPEIRVRDRAGNNVSGYPVSVALASGNGTLGGRTTAVTRPNGVGSWDDLRIDGVGSHTLRFVAGPVVAVSSAIVVTP